jgi:hypothetical protein
MNILFLTKAQVGAGNYLKGTQIDDDIWKEGKENKKKRRD